VIHFAANVWVVESVSHPAKYYQNNLAATLNLLNGMVRHGIPSLLFSSTCATYGNPLFTPITESHPQAPISPYGRTKWMSELAIRDYAAAYGLRFSFLRYFNVAGADENLEIGEDRTQEGRIIPLLIESAMGMRRDLAVFGDDFPTRDGTAIRDYIHVQDLAEAHVLALQWMQTQQSSAVFNLGTGTGTTVLELIRAVEEYSGKKIPYRVAPRREGEPAILTADARLARATLGWNPHRSNLKTILDTAWRWTVQLSQRNLKNRDFIQEALRRSDPERATIAERQDASEDQNGGEGSTPPKADSSGRFSTETSRSVPL
jgi:UDP-glucose-4-epimerase GalE